MKSCGYQTQSAQPSLVIAVEWPEVRRRGNGDQAQGNGRDIEAGEYRDGAESCSRHGSNRVLGSPSGQSYGQGNAEEHDEQIKQEHRTLSGAFLRGGEGVRLTPKFTCKGLG